MKALFLQLLNILNGIIAAMVWDQLKGLDFNIKTLTEALEKLF